MNEQAEFDPTVIATLLAAYAAFEAWREDDRKRTRRALQRSLWAIYDLLKR